MLPLILQLQVKPYL